MLPPLLDRASRIPIRWESDRDVLLGTDDYRVSEEQQAAQRQIWRVLVQIMPSLMPRPFALGVLEAGSVCVLEFVALFDVFLEAVNAKVGSYGDDIIIDVSAN